MDKAAGVTPASSCRLTIRLPQRDVEFVKEYARAHGLTVTEVIGRYLKRLRELEQHSPSPALEAISGLVPSGVDVKEEYRRHLECKGVSDLRGALPATRSFPGRDAVREATALWLAEEQRMALGCELVPRHLTPPSSE